MRRPLGMAARFSPTRSHFPLHDSRVFAMLRFALTIFLSAFLLFQVQPLIGKYILPWFGGSPGVWTTCMLMFQVLLLGGYAYAHYATSRWKPRTQGFIHVRDHLGRHLWGRGCTIPVVSHGRLGLSSTQAKPSTSLDADSTALLISALVA